MGQIISLLTQFEVITLFAVAEDVLPTYQVIGASVSEPLPSDVYVDFVCLSWTVVRHSNGACVSFFAHGPYGMATAHASHFLHVAVYVTMVTLFRR